MEHPISHPFDPACPYCKKSLRQMVEDRHKKPPAPKNLGVIPGSERVRFRPLDDGKEQIPPWANLDTQPKISQQRLTKPSPRTPR